MCADAAPRKHLVLSVSFPSLFHPDDIITISKAKLSLGLSALNDSHLFPLTSPPSPLSNKIQLLIQFRIQNV